MALGCARARRLLFAAVGGHASDAERLEVETHLDVCARCRGEQALADALRRLKSSDGSWLSGVALERIKRNALMSRTSPAERAPRRRWLAPAIAVGACVLAVVAGGLWVRSPDSRIVDGDVHATASRGRELGDGARLSSRHGGRVVLGGPLVELAPNTLATWRGGDRTVVLERGSVIVDVDPRQGKPFRVATPRFTVDVMGTRFIVDLDGVRTERGKVRVRDEAGRVVALVAAGEAWSVPAAAAPAPVAMRASAPAVASPVPTPSTAPPIAVRSAQTVARLQGSGDRLAQARQALSRGDAEAARQLVAPLLAGPRRIAADAQSLDAESYLVEGRYDAAIERYLTIARRFDGTFEGENALYAVAQLQIERNGHEAAIGTLTRYLERYPRGRFIAEVRARLDHLAARGR